MRFFLFLLISVFLFGCNSSQQSHEGQRQILIQKKWKYDKDAILAASEKLPHWADYQDMIQGAVRRMEFGVFEFAEDGKLSLTLNERNYSGTWVLSPNGKKLSLLLDGASNIPQTVEEFTEDRIILAVDMENGIPFPKILIPAE